MKYNIITYTFIFLLSACNPNFNTAQKDIKYPPIEKPRPKTEDELKKKQEEDELKKKQEEDELKKKQEEDELKKKQEEDELRKKQEEDELKKKQEEDELKKKQEEDELRKKQLKNTLLNDLREQIKEAYYFKEKYVKNMEKEPKDQYGMQAFNRLNWGKGTEDVSGNSARSIKFRRHTYTLLSTLDIHELKEFSDIMQKGKLEIFLSFSHLGHSLDKASDHLYSKKDNLDKLNISDLEQLKNSFKKILSIIKSVSEMSKQIILDYKNNNLIQTDVNELKSYLNKLNNEFKEKAVEAERLQKFIVSTYNP
ncbi:blasticidin-S acetyltransferase (plasmid) [Borreliella mayonii]|uniref:virulence associated lipoprotein n=1 Tax=Borreliella mayonii TaxID=1674146 RepID=UPI00094A7788|nr:virulence associated lipoprotein [Borreliella mayonii]APS99292.1 blasticidin-S acetyltransferase [Borreliella mayonii]